MDTTGIITTVAGNGNAGYSGDGGPAIQARLNSPSGVASDTSGNIYVADTANHRIRKVDPGGMIKTFAGNGSAGYGGDGGISVLANLNYPSGIATDIIGNIYIADTSNYRIRKIDTSGTITTVAGNGSVGYGGDGGAAIQTSLHWPMGVAADKSGSLYIADTSNQRIRKVDSAGIISTVAGNGDGSYSGDGGPAPQAGLHTPYGISTDSSGGIYIADTSNHRIRKVAEVFPDLSSRDIVIASEDGTALNEFDFLGRHLRTINALTGSDIYVFGYDVFGHVTSITDGDGNITTVQRDGYGNPTAIVAPGGQRTNLAFDGKGFLSSIADPAGNTIFLSSTTDGLLKTMKDPNGGIHSFTYDSLGLLTKDQDPAGGYKTLSRTDDPNYDGFTVTLSSALNRTNTYSVSYYPTGEIQRINTYAGKGLTVIMARADGSSTTTFPTGMMTTYTQGPDPRFGMQSPVTTSTKITTHGGLQLKLTRTRTALLSDPSDLLSLTTLTDTSSINGKTFASVYDASLRTVTDTTPMGRQSITTLDNKGKVVSSQVGGLLPVNYNYDFLGRLSTITQGSRTSSFSYDSQNRLSGIIDPMSRSVGFNYDQADRVIQETLPDSRLINYSYDANDNMTSITPPEKPAHGFNYTPVDLLQDYTPPSVGANNYNTNYSYNLDQQVTLVTKPAGSPVGGTGQNESLSFTYDSSLLTGVSWTGDITGSVGFTYNNDFRVSSESISVSHPGPDPGSSDFPSVISFTYDNDGLLFSSSSGLTGGPSFLISRDFNNGLLTGTSIGNVTDSLSYNGYGEPASYTASYSGLPLLNVQYTRDNLGRITQKTETYNGQTANYEYFYDLAGHLTDVVKDGAAISHYEYDSNGNRISYNNSVIGTYDNQDRLIAYGNYSFTYTDNGELAVKSSPSGTTQYSYDNFGNLKVVTVPNGSEIDYIVDGQNRRVGKRVNGALVQGFLYEDQLRPVVELDGSGNIISLFVYGTKINVPDYMIKGGVTYRIVTDHLGSPRFVVDVNSGVIIQQLAYDEFGNVTMDTNPGFQPFGFAGGLYDRDTGLVRFGARDYDPLTGKWTAKDPIRFKGGNANLYGYVRDPVNGIDPRGFYGRDVHYGKTYEWAVNVGISSDVASRIASANQELDEGLLTKPENPLNWLFGTSFHFQSRQYAEVGLNQALAQGNIDQFGKFLHILQDSFSHEGYGFPLGHISAGHWPDVYYENGDSRDAMMRQATRLWLGEFAMRNSPLSRTKCSSP